MYNISFREIQEFIDRLNKKTGKTYRLPTEAEWEYAARGGNKSGKYIYSGSDKIEDVAWYYENCKNQVQAAGTLKPNEIGLFDMSGNVWEICADGFDMYLPYMQQDPKVPEENIMVARGAAWHSMEFACRISFRGYFSQTYKCNYLGFRLVQEDRIANNRE
jgi:formylglycine-generating enzyme required for sulfatase activity